MQKLEQKRKEWESGLTPLLVVPVVVDGFAKVFVVLRYKKGADTHFCLHRYFKIGDKWDVSVDVQREAELAAVLTRLERDKDKSDMYTQITA